MVAKPSAEFKMAVADVVIKQEAVDAVDLEERVAQLCKENPKGITDQMISQDMPNIPPPQRVTAINRLLSMVGLSWNLSQTAVNNGPIYTRDKSSVWMSYPSDG